VVTGFWGSAHILAEIVVSRDSTLRLWFLRVFSAW
jgi:hypothetical protein